MNVGQEKKNVELLSKPSTSWNLVYCEYFRHKWMINIGQENKNIEFPSKPYQSWSLDACMLLYELLPFLKIYWYNCLL